MALDGVEVMKHFGVDRFPVIGHDRGGRVGHRLALDHPDKVMRLAVMDIVPQHYLYTHVTLDFVRAYPHWFNYLLPGAEEDLLNQNRGRGGAGKGKAPGAGAKDGGNADGKAKAGGKGKAGGGDGAAAEYARHTTDPAMIHGMCEDYRAAASIDLKFDDADLKAGKKVQCPLVTLWAANGAMGRLYDVLAIWKEYGANVSGKGLPPPAGHSLQESSPQPTLAELQAFLKG
jgi:haloacetate dehalogenase